MVYFLFFFTNLFGDFDYPVYFAALLAWYILECTPQVKFLKGQKTEYKKHTWQKPLGIGFAVWVIVVILSTVIAAVFGPPHLDRSSPQAYEQSCRDITEYLINEYMKPLEVKEFRDGLSAEDKEQVEAFKRLMLLLAVGSRGELNKLDGWDAEELLNYAYIKLQKEKQ